MKGLGLSYSDDFDDYYKIAGFTIFRDLNQVVVTRSIYDALTWLGEIGGLESILMLFLTGIMGSIASYSSTDYFLG